jgi:flagellar biosynthesis protein FlhA
MPALPFLLLGSGCLFTAWKLKQKIARELAEAPETGKAASGGVASKPGAGQPNAGADEDKPAPGSLQDFEKVIQVDVFTIELGYQLLTLADRKQGGDLLDRITGVRKTFARESGIIVPPISVRDNLELEANEYRFLLRNKEVARAVVMPNRFLAMNVANSPVPLQGVPAKEPVFEIDAVWITEEEKKNAEINGYTVVDASSVLITHVSETMRDRAAQILEREDTQKLIDLVKDRNPTLVNELLPDLVSVGLIQRVLQNLLSERVPVRNLTLILETIADFAPYSKNPDELSEQVRKRLGPYFVADYEIEPGTIRALTLEPKLEQALVQRVKRSQFEVGLVMDPATTQHLLTELTERTQRMNEEGVPPVLVVTAELRLAFKRFFEPSLPRLNVLSYQELPNAIEVISHGIIVAPTQLPPAMMPPPNAEAPGVTQTETTPAIV